MKLMTRLILLLGLASAAACGGAGDAADRAPRSGGKSRCDARCVSGGLPLTVESRAVRVVSASGPHPAGVVRAMPARWPGRSGGAGTVCAQPGV